MNEFHQGMLDALKEAGFGDSAKGFLQANKDPLLVAGGALGALGVRRILADASLGRKVRKAQQQQGG
ncbi:hypothetical protein EBT31_07595 [bacterium]|nr:hypothetical protein [bacterium]